MTSKYQIAMILKATDQASGVFKKMKGSIAGVDKSVKGLRETLKEHEGALQGIAVASSAAFYAQTQAINKAIKASNELKNSQIGLKSIVEGTGGSFKDATKFVEEYTKDGLVSVAQASTSLKNLLSAGFGLDEASQLMNRFKDSAAFGRQASLDLGQAIQGATEGLKSQNSILVDNAGVTKNISIMRDEYAQSIGKTAGQLTEAEKRQAAFVGILQETRFQVGDAAKLAQEFGGAQAKLASETNKARASLGEAIQPILLPLIEKLTVVVSTISQRIQENPKLAGTIMIIVTAITGLVAIATTVGVAIMALGPVFSALGAIGGVLATAIGGAFAAFFVIPAIIAAVITAGVLVYKNWDTIKAKAVEVSQSIPKNREEMKELLKTIWQGIKDNAGEILIRGLLFTMTGGMSEIAIAWVGGWEKMKTAMYGIVEPMVDWINTQLNKVIGFVSRLSELRQQAKSYVSDTVGGGGEIAGARAKGGPVSGGKTYLVGENGPELFTPTGSGSITPNNRMGGVNISLSVGNINNTTDLATFQRMVEKTVIDAISNNQLGYV